MGLAQKLTNKKVFLDTAPLIYYMEENQQYQKVLDKLFSNNSKGKFLFQTSTITLLEVLVLPLRQKEYENVFLFPNVSIKTFSAKSMGQRVPMSVR